MKDELGDVLLQVLLHSQLASEKNKFNFDDVAKNLEEKIIRRHPHVFTDKTGKNTNMEQIKKTWEEIKKEEKKNNPQKEKNPLNQLNRGPSLLSAHKIGEKSKKLDFDWDTTREVFNKCQEEFQELETALKENNFQNHSDVQEELGDLLFSLAQLSRHLGNNGETLLTKANQKFLDRFDKMNQTSFEKFQKEFSQLSREEKEKLWDYIKHAK
jgi:MazG family protein